MEWRFHVSLWAQRRGNYKASFSWAAVALWCSTWSCELLRSKRQEWTEWVQHQQIGYWQWEIIKCLWVGCMGVMIPLLFFWNQKGASKYLFMVLLFFSLDFFSWKIRHFPGSSETYRKYLLARNRSRVIELFPEESNFFLGVLLQTKPFL